MTVVVGTKTDLAYDREVSYEEASQLARDLGASYVEVSSAIKLISASECYRRNGGMFKSFYADEV